MQSLGIDFLVEMGTDELVGTLQKNRATHMALAKEARDGYIAQAKKSLHEKLAALEEGRPVSLHDYSLTVPLDYTHAYDTAIGMLKAHKGDSVKLNPDTYRHLVEDKWEWSSAWARNNSSYSVGTRRFAAEKRLDSE